MSDSAEAVARAKEVEHLIVTWLEEWHGLPFESPPAMKSLREAFLGLVTQQVAQAKRETWEAAADIANHLADEFDLPDGASKRGADKAHLIEAELRRRTAREKMP